MKFTGERILPGQAKLKRTYLQSLKAYMFAGKICKNKDVLDIGCGEGYGSFLLSKDVISVVGLDYDVDTVKNAKLKYKSSNLKFIHQDFFKNNLKAESFDIIVSFQTIEHFKDLHRYLGEIQRLLKKKGKLLVSTPNKEKVVYSFNPYHYYEFTAKSFEGELLKYFPKVKLYGLFGDRKASKLKRTNEKLVRFIVRFDVLGLLDKIPRTILKSFYTMGSNIAKSLVYLKEKKKLENLSLDNYYISDRDVKKALDLLAYCEK